MIKFAPLITLCDINQSFPLRDAVWTFSKNLSGVSNHRIRLNIDIVESPELERESPEGAIKTVRILFNTKVYEQSSDLEKRNQLLELIQDALLRMANHANWDPVKIHQAYALSIKEDLHFSYISPYKWNRKRSHKGRIEMSLEGDKVSLFGRLLNKKGEEVNHVHIIDTTILHTEWFNSFRTWKWLNDTNFGFDFGSGITLTISAQNDISKWSNTNHLGGRKFVEFVTYGVLNSQEDFAKWANW